MQASALAVPSVDHGRSETVSVNVTVDPELEELLREARTKVVSEEEFREQRISFAYGNAMSDSITKESVLVRGAYPAEVVSGCRMSLREADNPELYAHIQRQNLLRQYDLLTNCVQICLSKGIEAFDKYMLWSLNAAAVSNIAQFGGRFREQPIYVGDHIPPHFEKVPTLVDQCLSLVHETWTSTSTPQCCRLSALAPQLDSSVHRGQWAHRTGSKLLVDLPQAGSFAARQEDGARAHSREPSTLLRCPEGSDRSWADGQFNVNELALYLAGLLTAQLRDV